MLFATLNKYRQSNTRFFLAAYNQIERKKKHNVMIHSCEGENRQQEKKILFYTLTDIYYKRLYLTSRQIDIGEVIFYIL